MIHQRQRLFFRFEAGDHLFRIHPRLDDFQCDLAANGFGLFGHIDHTHAALANLLQQFVGADDRTGLFGGGWVDCWAGEDSLIQEGSRSTVCIE